MPAPKTITLNGTVYNLDDLTEEARKQVANIQVVDAEIAHLQQQLGIAQTARNAYIAALAGAVEKPPVEVVH
jgi:cell division protein ZapA (FtsZ GTPase activity inhibitor)